MCVCVCVCVRGLLPVGLDDMVYISKQDSPYVESQDHQWGEGHRNKIKFIQSGRVKAHFVALK